MPYFTNGSAYTLELSILQKISFLYAYSISVKQKKPDFYQTS